MENKPSVEVISTTIERFVESTGANKSLARKILEECSWDMSRSIMAYYSKYYHENSSNDSTQIQSSDCQDVTPPDYDNSNSGLSLCLLPLEYVRFEAKSTKRWILLSLVDSNFESFELKRDIFDNECVKAIVKNNFLFYEPIREQITSSIKSNYRIKKIPVVFILDPMTGENMKTLKQIKSSEHVCEDLLAFLEEHSYKKIYKNFFEKVSKTNENVTELKSNSGTIQNTTTSPIGTIRLKRGFIPDSSEIEDLQKLNPSKMFANDTHSNKRDLSSSLKRNIRLTSLNDKNSSPMVIALKLPNGERKIVNFNSNSHVYDLIEILEDLGHQKVEVRYKPKDKSLLDYPSSYLLVDLGVKHQSTLFITNMD